MSPASKAVPAQAVITTRFLAAVKTREKTRRGNRNYSNCSGTSTLSEARHTLAFAFALALPCGGKTNIASGYRGRKRIDQIFLPRGNSGRPLYRSTGQYPLSTIEDCPRSMIQIQIIWNGRPIRPQAKR